MPDDRPTLFDRYEIEAASQGIPVADLSRDDRQRIAEEFFADQFPGFELIGPASGAPIVVTEYDNSWPQIFDAWRRRLSEALGEAALRVEHVGSTAVPGLAAKPVVDIQVVVRDLEDEAAYVPAIESTGVPLRSRHHDDRYFRPPPGEPRIVQLHACEAGGDWQRNHLLFRDYLRVDAVAREEYADLKWKLAVRYREDRIAYTEAKTPFIRAAMERAEAWAKSTGWTVELVTRDS